MCALTAESTVQKKKNDTQRYDPTVPHFGESWQGSAKGDMTDEVTVKKKKAK
jgi:hypothetical protein